MPLMRFDPDAHPKHVDRRSRKIFPRELLLRRKTGARRSDARHIRSRLSQLHVRQTANPKTARRLQSAARRRVLAAKIPQRASQSRHAAHPFAPRDHAQGQNEMGRSAVKTITKGGSSAPSLDAKNKIAQAIQSEPLRGFVLTSPA